MMDLFIKTDLYRSNTHTDMFETIYLVQSDGDQSPIVIATNLPTNQNRITVNLPKNLIPSNACKFQTNKVEIEINPSFFLDYMTLGKPPYHCTLGNLRVLAARKGGKEKGGEEKERIDGCKQLHQK